MNKVDQICLSCKKYRPTDTEVGLCRLNKCENKEDYPVMAHSDSCDSWIDCGQQYFIRTGWVRKMKENAGTSN